MSKPLIVTLIIIAFALLGVGFWWYGNTENRESVVVQNAPPSFVEEIITPETPLSPEESIQAEIEELEAEKEKEIVTTAPIPEKEESVSSSGPIIKNRLIDWGYASKSGRTIDTVILHSSYNSLGGDEYSLEKIIQIYKDYEVGAHYIIDRNGTIFRLVEDKNIAYHAGASKMPDGRTNVNDFSIGIELINHEEEKYTSAQYEAVNDLIAYLKDSYPIKHVVGHSDIAPGRKTDPWNFDWKKLKN